MFYLLRSVQRVEAIIEVNFRCVGSCSLACGIQRCVHLESVHREISRCRRRQNVETVFIDLSPVHRVPLKYYGLYRVSDPVTTAPPSNDLFVRKGVHFFFLRADSYCSYVVDSYISGAETPWSLSKCALVGYIPSRVMDSLQPGFRSTIPREFSVYSGRLMSNA